MDPATAPRLPHDSRVAVRSRYRRTSRLIRWAALQAARSLWELAFPPACRLCNEAIDGGDFCRRCETLLTRSDGEMRTACDRCGIPRPSVRGPSECVEPVAFADPAASGSDPGCVHCKDLRFEFDRVIARWTYQDAVCDAIVAAKHIHRTALADALGRAVGQLVASKLDEEPADLVTFVPSHVTRQIARGGNGNETVARAVARRLDRPCRPLLRITRRIAKQAWLDDQQRRRNVRGAFALKKSYALYRRYRPTPVDGQHVLLVDDVLTTGATASEVARVLREGGARKISLAVVARTLRS